MVCDGAIQKNWDNFEPFFPPKTGVFSEGGGFSRYVGNFPEMWAEGFCNDVTIFSIISSSSAHIFRKLPTYLEKPHIRGCHQQL